jgi:hypothetical protein
MICYPFRYPPDEARRDARSATARPFLRVFASPVRSELARGWRGGRRRRWRAFRGSGIDTEQRRAILMVSVQESVPASARGGADPGEASSQQAARPRGRVSVSLAVAVSMTGGLALGIVVGTTIATAIDTGVPFRRSSRPEPRAWPWDPKDRNEASR